MNKDDFYLCLNGLNILLFICLTVAAFVVFITLAIAQDFVVPICLILLFLLAKIFLLYLLFKPFERFPYSMLGKVAKELKINRSSRKSALLLAFVYDVIIMLCSILLYAENETYISDWTGDILVYEIGTFGGICAFYISLFCIWKIQDKLKEKSQLQDANTSCKEDINE